MKSQEIETKFQHFKQTIEKMTTFVVDVNEEELYVKPSETEWSVMQIATHVVEAVQFWVADLEALLVVPDGKWGRNHEHVRRLAAVADSYVETVSKEEVLEQLRALVPLVEQAFEKVPDTQLTHTAPSYNPNFDGKPLSFLIDHLIVLHVESHLGQMTRHLAKVQQTTLPH